jgi:3-methyladenine DNA glycosylase AlkD
MAPELADLADLLAYELLQSAMPDRATNEKRYLKSDIEHYGVRVPVIRKLARRFVREHKTLSKSDLVALSVELWDRDVYELRKLAVNIVASRVEMLDASDLPFTERMLRQSHTWALIDDLAINVVAPLLSTADDAEEIRARWAKDDDFWLRRTAMLALLPRLRRATKGWDEFTRYADAMLDEEEFFIRKAIGWVLREVSKHSPDLVFRWIEPRAKIASAVTMREAVKYLPEDQQRHLKGLRSPR